MERLGEVGRSRRENRTDCAEGEGLARLTRGGEAARVKKPPAVREEKLDVEEAKPVEAEEWEL